MNTVSVSINDRISWRAPLAMALVVLLGFGFLYCLLTTVLVSSLFPSQAAGSLLTRDGQVVGSVWVAQAFSDDRYFYARPSAANYDPMAAAGSNWARSNPALAERMATLHANIAARERVPPDQVPDELLTASGAGFDPHLSPDGVAVQVARVARARGLTEAAVQDLVADYTEAPQFGFLGKTRVNVLKLNLALDQMQAGR